MTIKQKIMTAYFSIGVLFGVYGWLFGAVSYKGFAYNLGRGIVWPFIIFPKAGEIVGGIIMVSIIMFIVLGGQFSDVLMKFFNKKMDD